VILADVYFWYTPYAASVLALASRIQEATTVTADSDEPAQRDIVRASLTLGAQDTVAAFMHSAGTGFHFTGTANDNKFVYCQRYTEKRVDLACLVVNNKTTKPSGCLRYVASQVPLPKNARPEPLGIALGSIPKVARQVSEWPE
jgi:hypothetical protein